MIIGISGRIGSGKDTVGAMLQHILSNSSYKIDTWLELPMSTRNSYSGWQIKKFAHAVKQVCSILTGIPIEDFEKEQVKNSAIDAFQVTYVNGTFPIDVTTGTRPLTVEELLQKVSKGIRTVIHPNAWVNALMSKYKLVTGTPVMLDMSGIEPPVKGKEVVLEVPNWIITDVRFPNEAKAIKDRDGLLIRLARSPMTNQHESESALDDYDDWDAVIDNKEMSLERLYQTVKERIEWQMN